MTRAKAEKTVTQTIADNLRMTVKTARDKQLKEPSAGHKKTLETAQQKLARAILAEKRERFFRIAQSRATRVIRAVNQLSQCAKPRSFKYETDDIAEMFAAIDGAVADMKRKFSLSLNGRAAQPSFTFSAAGTVSDLAPPANA